MCVPNTLGMVSVDTFIEITGCSNVDEARQFLEASNGNLEVAISLFYDNGGLAPINPSPEASGSRPLPTPIAPPHQSSRPLRKALVEEMLDEYTQDLVNSASMAPRVNEQPPVYRLKPFFIFSLPLHITDILMGLIYKIPVPRFLNVSQQIQRRLDLTKSGVANVFKDVQSHVLNESYNGAFDKAKGEYKNLAVCLLSEFQEIPESVLENLKKLMDRDDLYLWVGYVSSSEAFRVAQSLHVESFPSIVVISPTPKTANSNVVVMEQIYHWTPSSEPSDLYTKIPIALEDHNPKLLALKLERQNLDFDRSIRKDQDSAYQRSLEADQQRAQEKERKDKWIHRVFTNYDKYTSATFNPEGTTARVSLRLPDGRRVNLKLPETSQIRDIYDIVFAALNSEQRPAELKSDLDETYEGEYGFVLMSTVLRKPVPFSLKNISDEPAVFPSGVLMVDLDDTDL